MEWYHLGESWRISRGTGVIVAVIDSGIAEHPDLRGVLLRAAGRVRGYNFLQNNEDLTDHQGHGTMVAGVIASQTLGIAPRARVLTAKTFDQDGAYLLGTPEEASRAIRWAADQGAKVINMSAGSMVADQRFLAAIRYARTKDALVVVSAGNRGTNNDEDPMYPCNFKEPNLVCVTYTLHGQKTNGANFGKDSIELAVNFEGLYTILNYQWEQGEEFVLDTGTSIAAPIVSATAALIRSARPDLSATQVKRILMRAGQTTPELREIVISGRTLDVEDALRKAMRSSINRPRSTDNSPIH